MVRIVRSEYQLVNPPAFNGPLHPPDSTGTARPLPDLDAAQPGSYTPDGSSWMARSRTTWPPPSVRRFAGRADGGAVAGLTVRCKPVRGGEQPARIHTRE